MNEHDPIYTKLAALAARVRVLRREHDDLLRVVITMKQQLNDLAEAIKK